MIRMKIRMCFMILLEIYCTMIWKEEIQEIGMIIMMNPP